MSNTGFYKKNIRLYINNVNENYKVSYLLSYDELLINEQNKNIQELNASPIPSSAFISSSLNIVIFCIFAASHIS